MKHPNLCRWLMYGLILAGRLMAGISAGISGVEPPRSLFVVGGLTAFGGILFGTVTVRCPDCGHPLPLKGPSTKHCPHCGEKLQ